MQLVEVGVEPVDVACGLKRRDHQLDDRLAAFASGQGFEGLDRVDIQQRVIVEAIALGCHFDGGTCRIVLASRAT
ncbi:MAG: hypothetical protein ACI8TP_000659 [Acidimicrobiales bacterium]|jgi:hypothetical protein